LDLFCRYDDGRNGELMEKVKHVAGKRAVGGGRWHFKLCGGKKTKSKLCVYVAPAYTTCKKCQKIVDKVFGKGTTNFPERK